MKTKAITLKVAAVLCSAFVSGVALAQDTYTWTAGAPEGQKHRLDIAANWDLNALPTGNGDIMRWDGLTTSNLMLTIETGNLSGAWGQSGRNVYLTANQVNSVTWYPVSSAVALRMDGITLEPGAAAFTIGDDNCAVYFDIVMGGLTGQTHYWVNNSTNPITIKPNVRFRHGGGGAHTFVMQGTGDFIIDHHMRTHNNAPSVITMESTGTLYWSRTRDCAPYDSFIQGPLTISSGRLVVKSANLINDIRTPGSIVNNALLEYDAGSGADLVTAIISGTGNLKVTSGKLTLAGANTFSGNITLSGGTLYANAPEVLGASGPLGVGGTISFEGGTLGWGPANNYDYSPRFATGSGQAYSFDTGGREVTLTTALGGTGNTLTKDGGGKLILAATPTYTGVTTVKGGVLHFAAGKSGTANIIVKDNAGLGVTAAGSIVQLTPNTLTLGESSGAILEFENITSTTTAPIAAGTVEAAGTQTINIYSGTFSINTSYPLLSWTTGTPEFSLGEVVGAGGYLTLLPGSSSNLAFYVTSLPYIWTGAQNADWDFTSINWVTIGNPVAYQDAVHVQFDDASDVTNITVAAAVAPLSVSVRGTKNYTITSSGANNIGGTGKLNKYGTGTLTLAGGANTYTGATRIYGGILSVSSLANGGVASDIGASSSSADNLLLDGGTLLYTGSGANIDRLFTLGTGGGTIDSSGTGSLVLNNSGYMGLKGSGGRYLYLTGTDTVAQLNAAIGDSGGGTVVVKEGPGTWILGGANTYVGGTVINDGTLQIGAGSTSGTIGNGPVAINNGRNVVFNRAGTLLVPGTISGDGSVLNIGPGTVILAANNTYSGGTTNAAGATLQIGNGGVTGSLRSTSPIQNDGLLIYDSVDTWPAELWTLTGDGAIHGSGNLIVRRGWLMAIGNNSYTGWTRIDAGATFQPCRGNTGQLLSSGITNNGTLFLVRQDGIWPEMPVFVYSGNIVGSGRVVKDVNNWNDGGVQLLGTNTYTGGTWIAGGGIVLGDGANPGLGSIVGNVIFTNSLEQNNVRRYLVFNLPEDITFSGNIISAVSPDLNPTVENRGVVIQNTAAKLTLTGNNTYEGGTEIAIGGTLQVGNGGYSGSVGTGPVVMGSAATLIFNRAGTLNVPGAVSGDGSVIQIGPGTVFMGGSNSYYGYTAISNGTLVVGADSAIGGDVYVDGGNLAPGGLGTVRTNYIGGNLELMSGNILITIDKNSPLTNSFVAVGSAVNYSGGALRLLNYGPPVAVGDRFVIFDKPVVNGAAMPIVSPGFTVQNNLAVDGSVTVTSVGTEPNQLTVTRLSPTQVSLSWPATWKGMYLQVQTNTLSVGISTNWVTVPGSDTINSYTLTIQTNRCVFARLVPVVPVP